MKRSMDHRRFPADIFHDVDLAAVGPMNSIDIVAQHPERRPDALAKRNLDPGFDTAIGLAELVLRQQPGGSIVATNLVSAGKSFLDRIDDQRAVLTVRVCWAARIGFEFVVAPTLTTKIKGPLGRINR